MLKKILHPGNYPNSVHVSLFLLRVIAGVFMLSHGMRKFYLLTGGDVITFPDPLGVGATASLALTVFAEVLCSGFLIMGFATRLSAIPLLITMLVAALIIHADDGFAKQELPLLFATVYLALMLAGSGKFSIDYLLFNTKKTSKYNP